LGEREGLEKERADKTADPLGMFPLANWISMTDLHFHMEVVSRRVLRATKKLSLGN